MIIIKTVIDRSKVQIYNWTKMHLKKEQQDFLKHGKANSFLLHATLLLPVWISNRILDEIRRKRRDRRSVLRNNECVRNTEIFVDMLAHLKVKKNVNTNLDDNLDSVGRDLKESRALYLPQGSSPVQ